MKRILAVASVSLLFGFGLAACGGGGGGGSSPATGNQKGFSVPTEISAVPTNLSGSVAGVVKPGSFRSKLMALKQAATDPGTDYSNTQTTKYVEEHSLEQFNIIEEIMKSLAQTHYADAENVNQGPYKAMVTQPGEQNGAAQKQLEPWVVDSSMIVENGQNVNRVQVWVEEPPNLIKAEFKIYASATKKADGSYADYGVWTLNAGLGGTDSFAASASVGPNGEAIVKVHDFETHGAPTPFESKGILNKSDGAGFGSVIFPDFSGCTSQNCAPAAAQAKYVYDASHLAVQVNSDPVLYKDRNSVTDMTHQYGMYDSATGQDVLKVKSFGFPVQYTDAGGVTQYAYYGAWQGRHQLWANGGTVPAGTVVTRQDRNSNQTAETYTVSQPFVGTLVKRTLVAADVSDIINIPVQTWVNITYNLFWDGSKWINCQTVNFAGPSPSCGDANPAAFTDFSSLVYNPNDFQRNVNISQWANNVQTNYVYLVAGEAGATEGGGFYQATPNNTGGMTPGAPYSTASTIPAAGAQLWANVGGSIYIEYTGVTATTTTGWVEKTVLSFDQSTWTPTFGDPSTDKEYTLDPNREYYINNQGINYVVKETSPGVYGTQIELQSVANPVNAATFVPAGTVFLPQWATWGDAAVSTYRFETATGPNYLKLVYNTIGTNDTNLTNASGQSIQPGDPLTQGQWGLMAYDSSHVSTGIQFNWDYPPPGQTFGTLNYLIDGSGAYKLLDDPIRLAPITLTNNAGQSKTFSLQFDGWMGGLPDLYMDLQKNNFVMTADISDKVVNIPTGTLVTDAADSTKSYLIKPLEMSEFLNAIADPGNLSLAAAAAVDLSTVPNYVDPGMGPEPATTGVKYSEGNLVQ